MALRGAFVNCESSIQSSNLPDMLPSLQSSSALLADHHQDIDVVEDNQFDRLSGTTLASSSVSSNWTPHWHVNAYTHLTGEQIPSERPHQTSDFSLLDTGLDADAEATLRAGYAARVRRGYIDPPCGPASGLVVWPVSPELRVVHLEASDPVNPSRHRTLGKSKKKMKGFLHRIFRSGRN